MYSYSRFVSRKLFQSFDFFFFLLLVLGNSEQHAFKYLEVQFTPRFLKCDERQHVDSTKEKSTIECSYSGNPQPRLSWFRQGDGRFLNSDAGVTVETIDEHHGKYKSIVTFERDKLVAIPLTTTTRAPNAPVETSTPARVLGDNYYQQLLNGGFVAKLFLNNNEEKGSKKINIFGDATQARANLADSSSVSSIQYRSTSILLVSLTLLFVVIQHPWTSNEQIPNLCLSLSLFLSSFRFIYNSNTTYTCINIHPISHLSSLLYFSTAICIDVSSCVQSASIWNEPRGEDRNAWMCVYTYSLLSIYYHLCNWSWTVFVVQHHQEKNPTDSSLDICFLLSCIGTCGIFAPDSVLVFFFFFFFVSFCTSLSVWTTSFSSLFSSSFPRKTIIAERSLFVNDWMPPDVN